MPYKNKEQYKIYQQQYYLRTRKCVNPEYRMSNKLFNELLNVKYQNIAEENKRLKKIILLHNINQEAIEAELKREPKIESEDNAILQEHQNILNKFIDKYGENAMNEKLLEYEKLNYCYDDCKNLYQKTEFLSSFIDYISSENNNIL
jgi:hypothetical protein